MDAHIKKMEEKQMTPTQKKKWWEIFHASGYSII